MLPDVRMRPKAGKNLVVIRRLRNFFRVFPTIKKNETLFSVGFFIGKIYDQPCFIHLATSI